MACGQMGLGVLVPVLVQGDDAPLVRRLAQRDRVLGPLPQGEGAAGLRVGLGEPPRDAVHVRQHRAGPGLGLRLAGGAGRVAHGLGGGGELVRVRAGLPEVDHGHEEVGGALGIPMAADWRAQARSPLDSVNSQSRAVSPEREHQARVLGPGEVVQHPFPRPLQRVHPRRRRQVEVQQPRQRQLPLHRRLFVALRARPGVEAYEVVVAIAAGRGRLQEAGVDQGLQQVLRRVRLQVQERPPRRRGRCPGRPRGRAGGRRGPGPAPAGRSRVRRWPSPRGRPPGVRPGGGARRPACRRGRRPSRCGGRPAGRRRCGWRGGGNRRRPPRPGPPPVPRRPVPRPTIRVKSWSASSGDITSRSTRCAPARSTIRTRLVTSAAQPGVPGSSGRIWAASWALSRRTRMRRPSSVER